MFPEFFVNKAKEMLSFLHIMKGKATSNGEDRKKGVDEEREIYLNERTKAEENIGSDIPGRKGESNQDISAI